MLRSIVHCPRSLPDSFQERKWIVSECSGGSSIKPPAISERKANVADIRWRVAVNPAVGNPRWSDVDASQQSVV